MTFSAAEIALIIKGKLEGNGEVRVSSFGRIEEAGEGQLSFLANPKYEDYLYTTGASIIIVNDSLQLRQPVQATLIRVADAYTAFALLLAKYKEMVSQRMVGIMEPCYIAHTARIGQGVYIGPFSFIGENVEIGDHTKIFPQVYIGNDVKVGEHTQLLPGVKIYEDCVVGNHVTIHAGTVVGSDGFGFAPQKDGSYTKVPQMGNVVIEDYVEIGANTTIDRATIGSTIIRTGAKLDNLIQIAHNVEIGHHTVIAAQAGVSGSTKIGNHAMVGGQAGIVGHITIADGTKINAQSGVTKSIKRSNTAVTGSPAYDYTSALRSQALSRNLPELEQRVKELEKIILQLMKEQV